MSYLAESTFGTTPAGNLKVLRMTGETFKADTNTTNSAEIRDDRMVADVLRTMVSASGDIQFELSYGTYDDFFAAALMSSGFATSVAIENGSTLITFAANTLTTTGTWDNNPAVGDWIEVRGATVHPAANGYYKVTAASSTVITVAQTITDTGAEAGTVTIQKGFAITNGTTETSFSFERKYGDLSNIFEAFVGMEINTFNLSITADGLVTGSFGFMGKLASSETSTIGDGYDAENTNQIYNATDNVNSIQEAYADLGATAFSLSLTNNLRGLSNIGTLGYDEINDGQLELTGTLQTYFSSAAEFNKYLQFTESSISVIMEDSSGNCYIIDIPNLNYTSGTRNAGSNNTDIIADLAWNAKRDSDDDAMITIVKFAA